MTKDPEIRYTRNNIPVASFTLAVNRKFAKEEDTVTADFFNVTAWSKTGEFVSKYFKKGQQIAVVGRLQNRNWEDQNGQKHYATDVIAEEVYFAGDKKEKTEQADDDFIVNDGNDLPF